MWTRSVESRPCSSARTTNAGTSTAVATAAAAARRRRLSVMVRMLPGVALILLPAASALEGFIRIARRHRLRHRLLADLFLEILDRRLELRVFPLERLVRQ